MTDLKLVPDYLRAPCLRVSAVPSTSDTHSAMLSLTELSSEYAPAAVAAAVGLYLAYSVRSWYRLRQFDGPWLAKHSYLWLARTVSNNKIHITFPELHKKYGQ